MCRFVGFALILLTIHFIPGLSFAGTIYEVTAKNEGEAKTYKVQFGGNQRAEQWTAFDPEGKAFVYLSFPRLGAMPEPVAAIWDSGTGETIRLYRFQNAKHPLPRIESIRQLKVCPFTGSKDFKATPIIEVD